MPAQHMGKCTPNEPQHPLRPTIEHIREVARGGQNNKENLCVIHYKCNQLLAQLSDDIELQFGTGTYY